MHTKKKVRLQQKMFIFSAQQQKSGYRNSAKEKDSLHQKGLFINSAQ